jgi:hypothetical protein
MRVHIQEVRRAIEGKDRRDAELITATSMSLRSHEILWDGSGE